MTDDTLGHAVIPRALTDLLLEAVANRSEPRRFAQGPGTGAYRLG